MTIVHGGVSPQAKAATLSIASEMPSQEDELDWIPQIFTKHWGADFGLLLRFMDGDPRGVLLASCHSPQGCTPGTCQQVVRALSGAAVRREGPRSGLHRQLVEVDGLRLQLSSLHFVPAAGVEIVVVCGRPQESTAVLRDLMANRLRPMLERYLRMWWLHGRELRRANAFRQTLDLTDLGVVLLDRRGSVLFANRCAERMMGEADGLQLHGRALCCSHPEEMPRLQAALHYTMLSNQITPAANGARVPARMIALRRRSRRSLILTLLNIERPAVDADDPAVIIYVLDPEHDVRQMLAPVYRLYQLSAVEARLSSELVVGASLADAATAIGVRQHTARGYLKQIFAKTETNRQADLIRLLLASAVRSSAGTDLSFL